MHRNISLYWICQCVGWGIAALYWSIFQIIGRDSLFFGILSVLIILATGIFSTHFYKIKAHKWGWTDLNLISLIPRLSIVFILLSLTYLIVSYFTITWIFGPQTLEGILGMLTGGTRYMAIWLLAFHLYHFSGSRRKAELDQKHFENLALSAQYNKLSAELNPHFLFNSLNSIKALIIEDQVKARTAVDKLSQMLRNSLHLTDQKTILIKQELERIEDYISLEKIRFEERLDVTFDIQGELLFEKIPPLTVYNLVENAIVHGLEKNKKGVKISIDGRKYESSMIIEVRSDTTLSDGWKYGTGLTNIKDRLELIYAEAATLEVLQEENQVLARLNLPLTS